MVVDKMTDINDIADYIISSYCEEKSHNNFIAIQYMKLQILVFYCQAWYLSEYKISLFSEDFEAWIFGPVNRNLFERFGEWLYKPITINDINFNFDKNKIDENIKNFIDEILLVYEEFDSTQLIDLVRRELPWKFTRKGLDSAEKCNKIIDKNLIMKYYSMKIEEYNKENQLIEEFKCIL